MPTIFNQKNPAPLWSIIPLQEELFRANAMTPTRNDPLPPDAICAHVDAKSIINYDGNPVILMRGISKACGEGHSFFSPDAGSDELNAEPWELSVSVLTVNDQETQEELVLCSSVKLGLFKGNEDLPFFEWVETDFAFEFYFSGKTVFFVPVHAAIKSDLFKQTLNYAETNENGIPTDWDQSEIKRNLTKAYGSLLRHGDKRRISISNIEAYDQCSLLSSLIGQVHFAANQEFNVKFDENGCPTITSKY